MLDAISQERLKLVHPKLAEKIGKLSAMMEPAGFSFRVTQGLRSWMEQEKLYALGREKQDDGSWKVVDAKAIVTKAPPGYSWHNFGLAVDLAPDDPDQPGYQPVWDASHPAFERMVATGVALGLTAGALWRSFPDYPHFQLTGRFGASPNSYIRQTFVDGGMEAVWKEAGL